MRVHSEIDSLHLSVCTTIFKRIAGLRFYPKCTLQFVLKLLAENSKTERYSNE